MKFNYLPINHNLKVYHQAKEILPIISEYEKGLVSLSVMRTLGLSNFSDFADFLKTCQKFDFDPVMPDMNWRKLKLLLISKTQNARYKVFIQNRTENQFKKILLDAPYFDRILNGRWVSKPGHTTRGRIRSGRRHSERLDSLESCFIPLINYLISSDSEVYDGSSVLHDSFTNQTLFYNMSKWYHKEILNFERVPKREIDITRNLLTNLVEFIDESKIDFKKLNSEYLISSIAEKIKQLMQVPNGTLLKCIKELKYTNGTVVLTVGNSYEVKGSSLSNGYVKVLIQNNLNSLEWCEYSHFEDVAFHRNDVLSKLFD